MGVRPHACCGPCLCRRFLLGREKGKACGRLRRRLQGSPGFPFRRCCADLSAASVHPRFRERTCRSDWRCVLLVHCVFRAGGRGRRGAGAGAKAAAGWGPPATAGTCAMARHAGVFSRFFLPALPGRAPCRIQSQGIYRPGDHRTVLLSPFLRGRIFFVRGFACWRSLGQDMDAGAIPFPACNCRIPGQPFYIGVLNRYRFKAFRAPRPSDSIPAARASL